MSTLTKPPLSMLDAGGSAEIADHVTFNGQELQVSPFTDDDQDSFVNGGVFDPETGIHTLSLSDESVVTVDGFLTSSNIGIGQTGPKGLSGREGAPGRDGKDGTPGERGCPGPKGDRGQIGPTGPLGPTGPEGPIGEVGVEGPIGEVGLPGTDGLSSVFVRGTPASYEVTPGGKTMQWGRFVDASSVSLNQVLFPTSFSTSCDAFFIEWMDPGSSNLANNVKIVELLKGSVTITTIAGFSETPTGWDFLWHAIGS